ncbi:hypothetical protein MXB_2406, partial [Myxobolus squamalis]
CHCNVINGICCGQNFKNHERNWTDFGGIKPSDTMLNSNKSSPNKGIIFHRYSPVRNVQFDHPRNNRYTTRLSATSQLRLGNGVKRNNYSKNKNNKRKKTYYSSNNDINDIKTPSPIPETRQSILEKYIEEFNPKALAEVIRLMNRQNVEYNSIGEDVELLTIIFFNGMHFHCTVCKAVYVHASTMQENHLKSVMHSKNVSSLQEIPSYDRILKNAFKPIFFDTSSVKKSFNDLFNLKISIENIMSQFEFGSKFTQRLHKNKSSNSLIFESITDSVIVCNNKFHDDFFGEEFIKPLTGFHCTLCKVLITQGSTDSVARHLSTLVHQNNVKRHLIMDQEYKPGFSAQEKFKKALTSKDEMSVIHTGDTYISHLPFSISDDILLPLSPNKIVAKQVNAEQLHTECVKDCGSSVEGVNNEIFHLEEPKSLDRKPHS